MFEEPEESPQERTPDPTTQASERFDEFRMHAELVAVFEGHRKFGAEIIPGLDAEIARDVQRTVAKLEKSRLANTPVINETSETDAIRLLNLPEASDLSTSDYRIHRRPGEVMMIRWLAGEQVDTFYTRMQAHFEAALNQFRQEERQSKEWKQDEATLKYLDALDAIEVKMEDRYLREIIRTQKLFVLSTQAADEMDILHLCDFMMGVEAAEIVGKQSAPPEEPTESDRAWFFKLFALRGIIDDIEKMCFFTYLQKSEEGDW